MLDVQSIFRVFSDPIKHIDVVAQFFYRTLPVGEAWQAILSRRAKATPTVDLAQGLTYVEFFTAAGLQEFLLHQPRKPDGVLQRFVLPKGDGSSRKNSQLQVFWSPLLTTVYRRTNYYRLDDRVVPIPTRLSTYDGPAYHSYESMVADDAKIFLTRLCEDVVRHFYQVEQKQITRLVLHFKIDDANRAWLLWGSSVRVQADRFNPSTLRVPPCWGQLTEVLNNAGGTVSRLEARRARQKHLLELDYHLFEATRDMEFALNLGAAHRRQAKVLGIAGKSPTEGAIASGKPQAKAPKGAKNPSEDVHHPLYEAFRALGDSREGGSFRGAFARSSEGANRAKSRSPLNPMEEDFSLERNENEGIEWKRTNPMEIVREELIALAMDAWYAVYSTTLTAGNAPPTTVILADPLLGALRDGELRRVVDLLGLQPGEESGNKQHYIISPRLIDRGHRLDRPSLQVEDEVTAFFNALFDRRGDEITRVCMKQYSEHF
ncbi:unnamed protein product [Phytomonas sp. Hart1]|nr:unnamed protein product [Phytomonas sp. Hart1]|eukprot:CCW67938.1 unnamed protein product [Phytomonas sp. isolate Hart1]